VGQGANGRNGQSGAVDEHVRPRDFLSLSEIEQLIVGAKASRYPERNQLLVLMLFRHGLRVSEALELRWDHLNLREARMWVERLKGSLSTEHPIAGDELRMIRRYQRTRHDNLPWVFVSDRGHQMTRRNVQYIIGRAGECARIEGSVHPHTLRHSCGYYLANKGHDTRMIQDYLGHRDPRHTAHYTRTASSRFEGLW
jgi:type 1 fimbriae regulatory protein FimB